MIQNVANKKEDLAISPILQQTQVLIVIVNYRTADMVINCLHSLVDQRKLLPSMRVVVTDNDSGDDSVTVLTRVLRIQGWQSWITIMPLKKNGGFSYGNNTAIQDALSSNSPPELIYLLNPDTIIQDNAVAKLAMFMVERRDVAIAGSALLDQDNHLQTCARRFPSPLSELDGGARLSVISRMLSKHAVILPGINESKECDWVSGASMMIRREVFEQIGLLDERYFLYFEELDFCHRAKKAGFSVWYVPHSCVFHLEGAATEMNQRKRRGRYWYDSRRRYFVKAYGILGLLSADILWAIGRLSYNIRRLLGLGSNFDSIQQDPTWFSWDLLVGDFLAIITGRAFSIGAEK